MSGTGKKALSAYFSKGKAKKATPAAEPSPEGGEPVAPAPAPATATTPSSSGWVDVDDESSRVEVVSSLRGRVQDLTDEEYAILAGEVAPSADLEADEAKDAFWNARNAAKRVKGKAPAAPAPAPAPASALARLEARKAGAALARGKTTVLDTRNAMMFPTLAAASSGLPIGAKFAEETGGDISRLGTKGAWGVFADENDEEEEEEEAEEGAAAEDGAPQAASRAAASATGAASATTLRVGTGPELTSDDEVRDAARKILKELRETSDAAAAIAGIADVHCDNINRRERIIEVLLQGGLDAERDSERALINQVLKGVVSHGAASAEMLANGVARVLDPELYEELVVDYPRAASYFATMLKGTIDYGGGAGGGHVPVSILPAPIAKLLPPPEGVKVPAPAPAASAATAAEPAAAEEGADDVDALFAGKKKKKGGKDKAAE